MSPLSITFPVALTTEAHRQAEQASQAYTNGIQAQQSYLNTLARFAVGQYLRCMGLDIPEDASGGMQEPGSNRDTGFGTDWSMAALSEATPLSIKGLGLLECCAILPDAQAFNVPPEAAWDERIGYVGVQLDAALQEARILGFTASLDKPGEALAIHQLESLEALLQHLHSLGNPTIQPIAINLTHWFQNTFEQGWQIYHDLLRGSTFEPAMGFRSPRLTGRKPLMLDEQTHSPMDLLITLVQKPDHRTRIEIQVISSSEDQLPQGLELAVLDEQGKIFLETHLTTPSTSLVIQPFTGAAGENFILSARLGEAEFQEYFIA